MGETAELPIQASALLEKERLVDLELLRGKIERKENLTEAERKRLQEHQRLETAGSEFAKSGAASLEPLWAKNQVELAKLLGASRKSVQRWLKVEGDDAPPAPAADGRYNVTMWKIWCSEHGHLQKKLAGAADRQLLEDQGIRLRNEKIQIENAIRRGELMDVDEVCRVVTEMVGGFVTGVRGMKHSLAPLVVGLTVPEATKRIGRESDAQLQRLALGEWAKKKIFWSSVYARLLDLHKSYNLGDGLSET